LSVLGPLSPRIRQRLRLAFFLALLLTAAAGLAAFRYVGSYLAAEDPLEKADAIFVFSGTRVERPLEAYELFRAGYAPRIVVTRAVAEQAMSLVEERGIRVASDFDLNRTVLLQLGVPESALITPDRIHDNTAEEAQTLRALILRHRWRKVILVSSKYHLRRVRLACEREVHDSGVRLIRRGSRFDTSTPEHWWRRRSDIRWLLSEIPKLIAYQVGLRT
jgi:uncharacterized SAM-binding protein YcdF (DUF218 family)